ncbi:Dentin sialophosphoprotein-like protein [Thalictrum thalictroides]|uniref:Dentin sialophosphoprotein-like protein n=1 Tax=Thalictrum thalictroides TaxID=46969 RepID=A0A7J6X2U2_THATH|nr:Dentin sialophosphoprotein-like protein [Thalictrum thalictroides]
MYGGSGKLGGRGGGGGRGSKRNNNNNHNHHSPYPPPPIHHRSIPPQSGRLSIGSSGAAPRNRQSNTKTTSASTQSTATREETFNIVSGNPLAFAMIIRLAPNLVDEIRHVEAHGGTARIKFDVNANNPEGNVIDVGGKDFRFTWSHEPGDLCDIYEECQSGENGSGLLVESGGAWRKLNVQRVLDESTKNHVKMRSEEAERKLKARKAIVLDHGNSSVNSQMKTSSTAGVEGRMASKTRKEPAFKKRIVELSHASGGPPKSVYKSGLSSTATGKGRLSVSPGPSPPEQSRPSASPLGLGNLSKGQMSVEDIIAPPVTSKEETSNREKEIRSRVIHAAVPSGNKISMTGSPIDVRSMLITALKDNPKGLNFKALEKAVGDPTVKIKPILEKIATYQAPGRYILKEGVEVESFKKPSPDSGSSPECVPDLATNSEKISPSKFEQQPQLSPQLEVSALVEKIDNQHTIPDLFGDRKVSDHSEERAGSSSDSSDSDSSDSGSSDSSRSKSRSPAGSGSGSSSDSESDGSSSNKEGSDVDVDIMTSDDEKEEAENKVQKPESGFSISPHPMSTEIQNEHNDANEDKQAGQLFGGVGIYREPPDDDNETGLIDITGSTPSRATGRSMQETLQFSPDLNHQGQSQQFSTENVGNKRQNTKDGVRLEHHDSPERISSSDLKYFEEKSESARRMKAGHSAQPLISVRNKGAMFNQNPNYLSPNRPPHDLSSEQTLQVMDRVGNSTADTDLQRGCGSSMPERSQLDAQQSSQRNADLRAPGNEPDAVEAPKKNVQNTGHGNKNFGKGPVFQDESDRSTFSSSNAYDKFSTTKDKVNRETVGGDKTPMPFRSQYRKNGEQAVNLKDAGQTILSDVESFPKDGNRMDTERSLAVNGRGSILRREPSDLELGELREPMHIEDSQGAKKKYEKKNSFKLPESNSHATDHPNLDLNKGRATGKINQETRKQLSPDSGVRVFGNQEDTLRKRTVGDDIDEATRPQQVNSLPDIYQFPRVDHADPEVGFELNKPADRGSKSRKNETRKSQGKETQGNENTSRKASVHGSQRHGAKNEAQIVNPKIVKEKKSRKSNAGTQLKGKDNYLMENHTNSQKNREPSPDEDNSVYFKYEKDEPELKGPIKDFSKYKEYVQEYLEKYDSYCSLNKSLETYRNKFNRLGHNLQLAKDTDLEEYYKLVEQLRENYRQYGGSHKRLKKIFLVLHEELKHLKKSIKDFAVSYAKD